MNIVSDKQTTLSNTGLVVGYAGIATAIVQIVDERLGDIDFSATELWLYPVVVAGALAFIWNKLKDKGVVKDNRA